jgi:hypothetical protein
VQSYKLSSRSPARNSAARIPGVDTDFAGNPRHTSKSPESDIGAWEHR